MFANHFFLTHACHLFFFDFRKNYNYLVSYKYYKFKVFCIWCDWPLRVRSHRIGLLQYYTEFLRSWPSDFRGFVSLFKSFIFDINKAVEVFIYASLETDFSCSHAHNFNFRFPPIVMFLPVSWTNGSWIILMLYKFRLEKDSEWFRISDLYLDCPPMYALSRNKMLTLL